MSSESAAKPVNDRLHQITAEGPRDTIEAAWDALAWCDPSPASAVDGQELSRGHWQLKAYAEGAAAAESCLEIIAATAPSLAAKAEEVVDQDWIAMSLEGLPPVRAGRYMVVGEHAMPLVPPGKIAILIEAGAAFGTGHHGTTEGCLLAMDILVREGALGRVLDLGTGSGVLAIAALKSGATRAVGSDLDHDSVIVARENGRKNHVKNLQILHGRGVNIIGIRRMAQYDTIFANILAPPLKKMSGDIAEILAPGGHLILSGLLHHQAKTVQAAFTARGLVLVDHLKRNGWSTLILTRDVVDAEDEAV